MWPFKWCNHHDHTEVWQREDTSFQCNVTDKKPIKTIFVYWCYFCGRRQSIMSGSKFNPEGWTKGSSLAPLPAPVPRLPDPSF